MAPPFSTTEPLRATPPASAQQAGRIVAFEGLRGLLAWWVVADHLLRQSGFLDAQSLPGAVRWLRRGDIAVDVFVILSGFVIFHVIASRRESFVPFVVQRFFRLYPCFLVCFGLALVLRPAHLEAMRAVRWTDTPRWSAILTRMATESDHTVPRILAHATLMHGAVPASVLPDAAISYLGPSWSISLEWQFYLLAMPLFLLCRRGWQGFSVAGAIVAGSHLAAARLSDFSNPTPGFLPLRLHLFALGAACYFAWDWYRARPGIELRSAGRLPLAAIVTAVVLRDTPAVGIWLVAFACACDATTVGSTSASWVTAPLGHRLLQSAGEISYSTYLVHMPVIAVSQIAIVALRPGTSRWGTLAVLAFFAVPVTAVLSVLLHRWVELPGIRAGRALAGRVEHAQS